jgi:hypothetical protein
VRHVNIYFTIINQCESIFTIVNLILWVHYSINNMESLFQVLKDIIKIKFAGKLNRMRDSRVIWIPKKYLDNVKELDDKQLLITIELEEIK